MKTHLFTRFKQLTAVSLLATACTVQGAEKTDEGLPNPWAIDLMMYGWLSGMDGSFSSGRFNISSDPGFVNIMGKLRNFPMAFSGRFSGYYDRVGFYLDGTYFGLDFRPRDPSYSKGLETRLGMMDYGVSYRVLGDTAATHRDKYLHDTGYSFDAYAGGRTIWLGNKAEFVDGAASMDASVSMPVIGGRINVDITPKWVVTLDGSVGGFGVDKVNFSSTALGSVGYRTTFFDIPTTMELGYKALSVKVSQEKLSSDITMHGLFLGLTGHW